MTTILIIGKSNEFYVLHAKQNADQVLKKLDLQLNSGFPALDDLLTILGFFQSDGWRYLVNGNDMVVIYFERNPKHSDTQPLSLRQRQVLQSLREGLSTKQIALQLQIRPTTVSYHIRRLKERLGGKSRAEFISKAAAFGLYQHPPE
jgi:DNA-binding CsgD family transcriptional regulator